MPDITYFTHQLFKIRPETFAEEALKLFRFQATNNPIYHKYLRYLQTDVAAITHLHEIPFMPISFFKYHQVLTATPEAPADYFESSGTTGQERSRHYIANLPLYQQVSRTIFERFYGRLTDFHVFALLPSYLERQHASLVAMADYFITLSQSPFSGFYLNNYAELLAAIQKAKQSRKVLLMGVSFALLELAELYQPDLRGVTVMETGGMKGRRKELTRQELHQVLKDHFQVEHIHSEYGMTELLSQAYALGGGLFQTPNWMRIMTRDINDPFCIDNTLNTGGINIIDLANIYSCAFIETQDLGRVNAHDNTFEVLGRFDNSDIRGCNLMIL